MWSGFLPVLKGNLPQFHDSAGDHHHSEASLRLHGLIFILVDLLGSIPGTEVSDAEAILSILEISGPQKHLHDPFFSSLPEGLQAIFQRESRIRQVSGIDLPEASAAMAGSKGPQRDPNTVISSTTQAEASISSVPAYVLLRMSVPSGLRDLFARSNPEALPAQSTANRNLRESRFRIQTRSPPLQFGSPTFPAVPLRGAAPPLSAPPPAMREPGRPTDPDGRLPPPAIFAPARSEPVPHSEGGSQWLHEHGRLVWYVIRNNMKIFLG